MGDIRLVWNRDQGFADFAMSGSDLSTGFELETAVIISLFTDAQADPGDIVTDTDPHGWWADIYSSLEDPSLPVIGNDRIGSKLWQAFARPRNQDTLNWAADQAKVALAWMITDGVASSVEATAYFAGSKNGIGIQVTITSRGVPTVYDYAWSQERG